jgi:hypothetical protein
VRVASIEAHHAARDRRLRHRLRQLEVEVRGQHGGSLWSTHCPTCHVAPANSRPDMVVKGRTDSREHARVLADEAVALRATWSSWGVEAIHSARSEPNLIAGDIGEFSQNSRASSCARGSDGQEASLGTTHREESTTRVRSASLGEAPTASKAGTEPSLHHDIRPRALANTDSDQDEQVQIVCVRASVLGWWRGCLLVCFGLQDGGKSLSVTGCGSAPYSLVVSTCHDTHEPLERGTHAHRHTCT